MNAAEFSNIFQKVPVFALSRIIEKCQIFQKVPKNSEIKGMIQNFRTFKNFQIGSRNFQKVPQFFYNNAQFLVFQNILQSSTDFWNILKFSVSLMKASDFSRNVVPTSSSYTVAPSKGFLSSFTLHPPALPVLLRRLFFCTARPPAVRSLAQFVPRRSPPSCTVALSPTPFSLLFCYPHALVTPAYPIQLAVLPFSLVYP